MTANINKIDNITSVEKTAAYEKLPSKDSISTQMSELRDADPKGYLNNIKLMDNLGLDPKSCPKLELLGENEMLEKKQALLKDQKNNAADTDGGPKEPKKFTNPDGGSKDGKGFLQDFSVQDLEIKIKLDVASSLKKDSEVKLPNHSIQQYEN